MEQMILTNGLINAFRDFLISGEKSPATVDKYIRDARAFAVFCEGRPIEHGIVLE